jgi:hypothetical protein
MGEKHVKGLRDYWKGTPNARFDAWNHYKNLVDKEVSRLERLLKNYQPHTYEFEEVRHDLNEMYKTAYSLEHNNH